MRVLYALSTLSHKENAKIAVPPTLLNQQRSYFLHDKSDSRLETVLHHLRRPRETWRDRKRPIVFFCVGLFILVAAVVGIAVGVRAATGTHAKPNGEEGTSVHKDSRIAVSQFFARENDTASRLIFFQDGAGDLVVVEDRQNHHTTYRLKSRLAKPPQALPGTPLRVEFFGGDKRIHLFYLDLENYVRHATGILPVAGPVSWQINPAFTKGGNESHRSGQHIATAVIGSANASLPGEVVGLAFWSMDDKNQRRLILSDKPASESIWHENRMESDQSVDKKMTESSIELVSLSVPPAGLSGAYFPRIISNYPMGTPNDNITRVDCGIRSLNDEIICLEDLVDWKHKEDKEVFQNSSKPLKFARLDLTAHPTRAANNAVLGALDNSGAYYELLWENYQVIAAKSFPKLQHMSTTNKSCVFSQVAPTRTGMLFVTSCGQIVEFRRLCIWWTAVCDKSKTWEFVNDLNLTLTKDENMH